MPAKLYDWEGWFAQEEFKLVKGEHYNSSQSTMSQMLRNEAAKRHVGVAIIEESDGLLVKIRRRPPDAPSLFVQSPEAVPRH